MPEVAVKIGGRPFIVACQEGEESFLEAAARMLDAEAVSLISQIGRMPEDRMLLMSGLLLADKTAASEDRLKVAEHELRELRARLQEIEANGPVERRVEVPVIPPQVVENMAEMTARAEAIAEILDEKIS